MPRRSHLSPAAAHGRRVRPRVALAVALLTISPAALGGCSPGPAKLAVPSPAPEVADACTRLIQALPAKVLDAERRETEPVSALTTAYGDPPIEVTCGVATPAGMAEAESQCFEVNGVGWFAEEVSNGTIFTTIGRRLFLEIAVPKKYTPEANALTDVSDAVKAHNTLISPCT
ncbi:DUF3515 domain-containing protein [Kribbella sp. CA-293567]|uniref:DUF3515 domain-containing protein n=1 Tax=Kribbella sp. CA-293567 TaxID=3002436 RepID=UPI0022DE4C50|nr:DUF3515 domain-containing protein [Kribbella sp. CA-293567]WBQ07631.1 DUF3515 domain-containing protein [Kribbella sp. CA-293567]